MLASRVLHDVKGMSVSEHMAVPTLAHADLIVLERQTRFKIIQHSG